MPGPIRRKLYDGDDPDSMMLRVRCQECDAHIADVARDEVERRIARGEYVTRRAKIVDHVNGDGTVGKTERGVFGVCRKCAALARVQADSRGSDAAAEAQMIRIRERVALIRERRSDLTLEQAVHAAVEDEYDPHNESDRGFRAYLLGEGAPKDDATDAAAREFVAHLPEGE